MTKKMTLEERLARSRTRQSEAQHYGQAPIQWLRRGASTLVGHMKWNSKLYKGWFLIHQDVDGVSVHYHKGGKAHHGQKASGKHTTPHSLGLFPSIDEAKQYAEWWWKETDGKPANYKGKIKRVGPARALGFKRMTPDARQKMAREGAATLKATGGGRVHNMTKEEREAFSRKGNEARVATMSLEKQAEFGRMGANARNAKMSREERAEVARKAAVARWAKKRLVTSGGGNGDEET